jgi:predicted XRE-type DNA-binding protein
MNDTAAPGTQADRPAPTGGPAGMGDYVTKHTHNGVDFHTVEGSVFYALFEPEEAADLTARSELMAALKRYIDEKGLTQTQAAERMGTSQPRISALKSGKIGEFTIDALVRMAGRAGLSVSIALAEAA